MQKALGLNPKRWKCEHCCGSQTRGPPNQDTAKCGVGLTAFVESIISTRSIMANAFKSALRTMGLAWFRQRRKGLRERIMRDYGTSTDPEIREVISFVERHREIELPVGMVPPYEWVNEYRPENVHLDKDESAGMLFATINGRRIFFPRKLSEADVRRAVS